jgi:hypothetical protein
MNILIVIIVLAVLGLLGVVTKSIIAVLIGAAGLAVSFLVFCTGVLLGLLGKIIVVVLSLAIIGAAIILFPVALFAIIPGIYFAYLFARSKGYYQPRAI